MNSLQTCHYVSHTLLLLHVQCCLSINRCQQWQPDSIQVFRETLDVRENDKCGCYHGVSQQLQQSHIFDFIILDAKILLFLNTNRESNISAMSPVTFYLLQKYEWPLKLKLLTNYWSLQHFVMRSKLAMQSFSPLIFKPGCGQRSASERQ